SSRLGRLHPPAVHGGRTSWASPQRRCPSDGRSGYIPQRVVAHGTTADQMNGMKRIDERLGSLMLALLAATLLGCGAPQEAPRVQLPVFVDSSAIATVTTDLGYEVELTEARAIVENFAFTIA